MSLYDDVSVDESALIASVTSRMRVVKIQKAAQRFGNSKRQALSEN